MASGHGINGRVGRCYPFFAEFKECMVSDFSQLRLRKCNGHWEWLVAVAMRDVGDDGRLPVTLTRFCGTSTSFLRYYVVPTNLMWARMGSWCLGCH